MLKPGPNLILRPYEPNQWEILNRWQYDEAYQEFFRDSLGPMTEEQLRAYGVGKQCFMIFKESNVVGIITIGDVNPITSVAKAGILIDKEYQKSGYFLESLWIAAQYLFKDLRLRKLVLEVMSTNARLRSMVQKIGFEEEAILKDEAYLDGKFFDMARYFIFRDKALVEIEKAKELLCQTQ